MNYHRSERTIIHTSTINLPKFCDEPMSKRNRNTCQRLLHCPHRRLPLGQESNCMFPQICQCFRPELPRWKQHIPSKLLCFDEKGVILTQNHHLSPCGTAHCFERFSVIHLLLGSAISVTTHFHFCSYPFLSPKSHCEPSFDKTQKAESPALLLNLAMNSSVSFLERN